MARLFSFIASCLLLLLSSSALAAAEERQITEARFHSGDAEGAEKVEFDDSRWKSVSIPCSWSDCELESENYLAWYRLRFSIDDLNEQDWAVHLGRLWGAEEVFLNGKQIGGRGVIATRYAEVWGIGRTYDLPRELLSEGENVLALRMLDNQVIPGLAVDPVVIGRAGPLNARAAEVVAGYRWRFGAMFALAAALLVLWIAAFFSGFRDLWTNLLGLIPTASGFAWIMADVVLDPTPLTTQIETVAFFGLLVPTTALFPFAVARSKERWVWVAGSVFIVGTVVPLVFDFRLPTVLTVTTISAVVGLLFTLIGWARVLPHFLKTDRKMVFTLVFWMGTQLMLFAVNAVPALQTMYLYEVAQVLFLLALGSYFAIHFLRYREGVAVANARILAVADEERRKLARDLHDGVGQDIQAARMSLQILSKKSDDATNDVLQEAVDSLSGSLDEVRALARSTHPEFGGTDDFQKRARKYIEQMNELSAAELSFSWDGVGAALDGSVALDAFRVLQESVTNALRHGEADGGRVEVNVRYDGKELSISVSGGRPFNPLEGAGIGWRSMTERAKEHGGELVAAEEMGRAVVRFSVPVES